MAPNRAPNQTMARKYKLGAVAVSFMDIFYPTKQINRIKDAKLDYFFTRFKRFIFSGLFFIFLKPIDEYGQLYIQLAGGETMK